MIVMDEYILIRLSKLIWYGGAWVFIILSLPNLWGTIDFLFSFLSGLVSEIEPSQKATAKASAAFSKLFPTLVFCSFAQLFVFATPFITTQSKALIEYYQQRESEYANAVSGRLELAKQITEASQQLKAMQNEIQQCRALLNQLGIETKTLTKAVTLSRQSLTAQISQTNKLNSKGDF